MVFCDNCRKDVRLVQGDAHSSCGLCGKVLRFEVFSTEATFVKDASGFSRAAGSILRTVENENASRQRLYDNALCDMLDVTRALGMSGDAIAHQAMRYYRMAVERSFTKGRRTDQVQAACLYIACRENRKPYLLIDFSNQLRINIYVLGAVFLQLCKLLSLTEHPICQKLLDPSIFIHKFTANLTGGRNKEISNTALTIIASMNRDWMQTGRRPSGLWGAALYISALAHGVTCSKTDILKLVHVCEQTLSKRLVEFENTESGSLTIEELNAKADELKESLTEKPNSSSSKKLLCHHKGDVRPPPPFACGLCKDCYSLVIGFEGGSDPPAFQHAERIRMNSSSLVEEIHDKTSFKKEVKSQHFSGDETLKSKEPETVGCASGHLSTDGDCDQLNKGDDMSSKAHDESDGFSDIDDAEVDGYLHNEEEKHFKKIIWEEMNREYLEEQAAKEAAAAAAREAWEANFKDCPEELLAAKELEAVVAAAMAKSKKEKQQKRAAEARNLTPAQSASEAAHRMLTKKRISSKINYDVLEKLFEEPAAEKDSKKSRTESHSGDGKSTPGNGKGSELEGMGKDNDNDLENEAEEEEEEEEEEEGGEGAYNRHLNGETMVEAYQEYDDDYGDGWL